MLSAGTSISLPYFEYSISMNMGESISKFLTYFISLSYIVALQFVIPIFVIPILGILLISIFFLKKHKSAKEEVELVSEKLDNRDLMILEAIKRGYKTLTEISTFTGLPKSTTYRRLRKLTALGYLNEDRGYGKVFYQFNVKAKKTKLSKKKITEGIVEGEDKGKSKKSNL
ncbi:helix-turn-helix domain-containing protein [Stygiolobus caldivivus]|uniref:HTH iclR-type domain-containing protein n=1 Tax=Stygiolobus caldivivus TaxID=2824673 RepID=A0A8D5U8Z9_9CREN|nr:helix-turn-helix domain-containing protein [Stygiolobus caldivivus]BCU70941.1 hypothetical protein KN1_22380 [Stygiolobus caldivivus]